MHCRVRYKRYVSSLSRLRLVNWQAKIVVPNPPSKELAVGMLSYEDWLLSLVQMVDMVLDRKPEVGQTKNPLGKQCTTKRINSFE